MDSRSFYGEEWMDVCRLPTSTVSRTDSATACIYPNHQQEEEEEEEEEETVSIDWEFQSDFHI